VIRLGIDTASVVCVGLARDEAALGSLVVADSRAHVEKLIPLAEELLAGNGVAWEDLDEIAVGVGPGPFTGLRVGVAAAIALGEALAIEVRGVCTLDALALQVGREVAEFVVASDARRRELYWARYAAGQRMAGPFVTRPSELPRLPICGPAARLYELPGPVLDAAAELDAGLLAANAHRLPAAGLEPLYLRRPDADVSVKHKSVLPRISRNALRDKGGDK
jgi:tRNA threonylcarbamoyl adenosine modification protein YeaZ